MATSTHNKYVSIPDWFSSSSSTPITSAEKPANITNVYYGGGSGGGTTGITEIPIDNKTIVWQDQVITVPIDNDKIIINTEGKITTSGTTGVWELRQLTDGTNYIYTTYPVVTQLGITMYAGTDGLDLGSIYDGLPIDNATIYWDLDENGNKILKAVGSSGGVADSVAWANVIGKPDWLLDGKIQYTEIEGIPDLSGFITKDYIDGKFVTFDLNETIDGIKTFTNGIKIGTSLINQSQNDVIYIDANLVVRGGITMYATGTVDIPSVLDSLPVAGTDSKGIASFDSSYFSVTNGKVTLLADNVGLNESELAEYLNTNNYAKKSDIPSLNGYATQSWVESKGYALNSDLMLLTTKVDDFLEGSDTDTIINKWLELEAFLSGLSESDNLATILSAKADKDYVDDTFVTLTTTQTITGEKNFTGGLKVNGSPIYYDTEKKYWKLEGDLLVTGGVTMYGSDSSFTPSTIMDAIAVDGTTISKDGGVLKVIGGTGGGVADSVAWGNITGKPTWIGSSKPSYSYSEITGAISTTDLQNYLTSNSYLNVTSGDNRYLKLSGGILKGSGADLLQVNRTDGNSVISYYYNGSWLGRMGYNTNGYPIAQIGDAYQFLLHSGNYSNYALPLSGGRMDSTSYIRWNDGHEGNDFSDWNSVAGETGLKIISSIVSTSNAPSTYSTALHVKGRYGFQLASIGGGDSKFYIRNIRNINDWCQLIHSGNINSFAWTSSNDGSGSGLDADLLDGKHNGELTASILHSGGGFVIDANTIQFSDFSLRFYSGIPNTSTNLPTSSGYQNGLLVLPLHSNESTAQIYLSVGKNPYFRSHHTYEWNEIAYKTDNVSSATKLQTPRTIWGQSFDGTGDIEGAFRLIFPNIPGDAHVVHSALKYKENPYGLLTRIYNDGAVSLQVQRESNVNEVFTLLLNPHGGNVGIGTTNPKDKLDVNGNIIASEYYAPTPSGGKYSKFRLISDQNSDSTWLQSANAAGTSANGIITLSGMYGNDLALCKILGPLLVTHGITMYSDQRKKTILNHVELSLKQIAEAPLIEHYYNGDDKRTTHVGSIAQYWAEMNDWFCKLDSEGYYTMEIQNAALASAISIARELDRYETKTDKAIKKLKKRIYELEEEVERLKAS